MKTKISIAMATMLLVSSPAFAQQGETWQEQLKRQFSNENVSRTAGILAGALLGTQIGSGRGRTAAIIAGALAGYWAGGKLSQKLSDEDKVGIATTTERAIETGQTTTWSNPNTGVATRVSVSDATSGASYNRKIGVRQVPALELVNSYFAPSTNLNVRGGPGTDYDVLYTLQQGTLVPVIGKVAGSEWFLISENGTASGFVYAPLMDYREDQTGNAIRHSMNDGTQPARYQVASNDCRNITQEVTLGDGTRETHTFKACQQGDGTWREV